MATAARLDELKKKFDENPRRYFAPLANEHRKQGDLSQAISICRTHLPNQPGHISGHIVLAQALYESHELGDARQVFEAALDLDPENLIALRYLGDIARERGEPQVARVWYRRVLETDPRNEEIAALLRALDEPPAPSEAYDLDATPVSVPVVPNDKPAPVEIDASAFAAQAAEAPITDTPMAADSAAWQSESVALPELESSTPFQAQVPDTLDLDLSEIPSDAHQSADLDSDFGVSAERITKEILGDDASLDLPAVDATPRRTTPTDLPHQLGEWEAVAEPTNDDWFAGAPEAEAPPFDAFELEEPVAEPPRAAQPTIDEQLVDEFRTEEPSPAVAESATDAELSSLDLVDTDASEPSDEQATVVMSLPAMDGADAEVEQRSDATSNDALDLDFDISSVSSADTHVAPLEGLLSQEDGGPPIGSDVVSLASEPATLSAEAESLASGDPSVGRTPAFGGDVVDKPSDAFATETMAELYLQQGFHEEALAVYRTLLERNPTDQALRDRVDALAHGAPSSIPEAAAAHPRSDRHGQSVRTFFGTLARRTPGRRDRDAQVPLESLGTTAADAEPAREMPSSQSGVASSLTQLFAARPASTADSQAASTLATAFSDAGGVTPVPGRPTRAAERELSLEHLFRDVPERSSSAVTLDEFYGETTTTSEANAEQDDASQPSEGRVEDIAQFTAWLEGLKKK